MATATVSASVVVRSCALALLVRCIASSGNSTGTRTPNDEDDDQSLVLLTWVAALVFGVFICLGCVAAGVYFLRVTKEASADEEVLPVIADVGTAGAEEWLFMRKNKVNGPVSNAFMRYLLDNGKINRQTTAKIECWTSNFVPIEELFPTAGTEFTVLVNMPEAKGAGGNDWHRKSVHHSHEAESVPTIGQKRWFFVGPDQQVHGPFENGKMRHWYMEEYFLATTMVRPEDEGDEGWLPIFEAFPEPLRAFATVARKSQAPMRSSIVYPSDQAPMRSSIVYPSDQAHQKPVEAAAIQAEAIGCKTVDIEVDCKDDAIEDVTTCGSHDKDGGSQDKDGGSPCQESHDKDGGSQDKDGGSQCQDSTDKTTVDANFENARSSVAAEARNTIKPKRKAGDDEPPRSTTGRRSFVNEHGGTRSSISPRDGQKVPLRTTDGTSAGTPQSSPSATPGPSPRSSPETSPASSPEDTPKPSPRDGLGEESRPLKACPGDVIVEEDIRRLRSIKCTE
eukprot:TRINITY_DN3661_c0_g1_i1.p1 TRINITY_DN3661_c0_g1~~TRINITY_DN3661_c0_g1_i1.p1  ORF type:complete len:507 (-),score=80.32 TRINITY_DN3661_c0_g1_i1:221-1741(-)